MKDISLALTCAIVVTLTLPAVASRSRANRAVLQSPTQSSPACRVTGALVPVRDLGEGSGIATSRSRPGVLWAHNDSTGPELVMLNEAGGITGRVRVEGASVDDWEDIAVGPCPRGSCIYVGDIGDNRGTRRHVTVYRVPEPPEGAAATARADAFHAAYPDGPQDAESLFVTPASELFIITKGDPGPVALYRFPNPLRAGTVMQLERVGGPLATDKVESRNRPTGADMSEDGEWVAVRTTHFAAFYPAKDLIEGRWKEAARMDLSGVKEPRGEGIAFGRDREVFLLGEGGGIARAGTFARLSCALGR